MLKKTFSLWRKPAGSKPNTSAPALIPTQVSSEAVGGDAPAGQQSFLPRDAADQGEGQEQQQHAAVEPTCAVDYNCEEGVAELASAVTSDVGEEARAPASPGIDIWPPSQVAPAPVAPGEGGYPAGEALPYDYDPAAEEQLELELHGLSLDEVHRQATEDAELPREGEGEDGGLDSMLYLRHEAEATDSLSVISGVRALVRVHVRERRRSDARMQTDLRVGVPPSFPMHPIPAGNPPTHAFPPAPTPAPHPAPSHRWAHRGGDSRGDIRAGPST
jgi:hypothetical protein